MRELASECICCYEPTDTGLALRGEAEVVTYGLIRFGLPAVQAVTVVLTEAHERNGCDYGQVPGDDMTMLVRVCAVCAAPAGMTPRLALPGAELPVYGFESSP